MDLASPPATADPLEQTRPSGRFDFVSTSTCPSGASAERGSLLPWEEKPMHTCRGGEARAWPRMLQQP
jgi:hypothetical protein